MKLCNIFNDHMMFQQGKPIRIWGSAAPGEEVTAELFSEKDSRIAHGVSGLAGTFLIELDALQASYVPYTLKVSSQEKTAVFHHILIGELWMAAGQSNMQFEAALTKEWDTLKEKLHTSDIRILTVRDTPDIHGYVNRAYEPQENLKGFTWSVADRPEQVENTSAVGLHVALELEKALKVPVGILDVAVGGSSIESWLARETLENDPVILRHLKKQNRYMDRSNHNTFQNLNFTQMTGIYNERLAPLVNYPFKGVLWYQGESNLGGFEEARYYEHALLTLFTSYRDAFRSPSMPFLCSQLAAHNYAAADRYALCYMNEAIEQACRRDGNACSVVIRDIPYDYVGKPDYYWHPVHPIIKEPVGKRMARLALYREYGAKKVYGFTGVESCTFSDDEATVVFEPTYGKLAVGKGRDVLGFTVAGEDGVYHEAVGRITGDYTVSVASPYVSRPAHLCYGFYTFNDSCNLTNALGLPVLSFRTEREDAGDKPYYDIQKWTSCDFPRVFENTSEPSFGVSRYRPTWRRGTIFGETGIRLSFHTEDKTQGAASLLVRYEPTGKQGNFIGVSPVIDYRGHAHCLDNFRYLTFDLKNPNQRDILFWGLHIQVNANEVYKVCFRDFDSYSNYVIPPSEQFASYTVDLEKAINAHGDATLLTPAMRKTAHKLQFTFIDKESGCLLMDNIRLHNQTPF